VHLSRFGRAAALPSSSVVLGCGSSMYAGMKIPSTLCFVQHEGYKHQQLMFRIRTCAPFGFPWPLWNERALRRQQQSLGTHLWRCWARQLRRFALQSLVHQLLRSGTRLNDCKWPTLALDTTLGFPGEGPSRHVRRGHNLKPQLRITSINGGCWRAIFCCLDNLLASIYKQEGVSSTPVLALFQETKLRV
jgi:hypothetical protein